MPTCAFIDVQWSQTRCSPWPQQSPRGEGWSLAYWCFLAASQPRLSCQESSFHLTSDPWRCSAAGGAASRSGSGPGLWRIWVCVVWGGDLGSKSALWFSLKCVSERIIKQACIYLCLYIRLRLHGNCSQDHIFFSVRFSLCSLYPQADVLITTSLVNWKCEPRKRDSAKKVCALIGSPAERLVVCRSQYPRMSRLYKRN